MSELATPQDLRAQLDGLTSNKALRAQLGAAVDAVDALLSAYDDLEQRHSIARLAWAILKTKQHPAVELEFRNTIEALSAALARSGR